MKKAYQEAQIQLRDNQRIVIYFKNKRWSTGFKLTHPLKNGTSIEWSTDTESLTSQWKGGNATEANEIIYNLKLKINNLIKEARSEKLDILPYIESNLEKENQELLTQLITKKTKPHEGLAKFIERKLQLKFFKNEKKSYERFKGYITNLRDFYELENKATIGGINEKWVRDLCTFLTTKRERNAKVYRGCDNREYKTTRSVQLTNSTLKRLLSELNQMLSYLNTEHDCFNFPTDDISKLIKKLPTRAKYKQQNTAKAYDHMSWVQWNELKNFQLDNERRESLKMTLDLYKFCCNTGLRFSDATRLCDDYIIEDNVIFMEAEKNKTRTVRGEFTVPMNADALRIFNMYGRDFRKKFPSNQQINQNLKKVLKEIDAFKEKRVKQKYILMQVIDEERPAHEVITFHSSRGHFVNMCINKFGANISELRNLTGWQDTRTLTSYMSSKTTDNDDMRNKLNSF